MEKQQDFCALLDSIDFSVAEHEMLYDEKGNPIDYRYLYVNKAFCNGLQMERDEVIGKTVLELLPTTEYAWIEKYNEVLKTGNSIQFVDYASAFDQHFSVYAYKKDETKFVVSFKNVTDLVKAENVQPHDEVIANTFSEGETAYFEFNIRKKVLEYSPVLEDIVGQKNVTYDNYVELFNKYTHPADQKRTNKSLQDLFNGDINDFAIQVRFYNTFKSEYVWISYFAYAQERIRKIPVVIKGIIKDIDFEKKKQIKTEKMNKMFRETRKIANITTFYYDTESETFNHSAELDDFIGLKNLIYLEQMRKIVHPDDLEQYDSSTERIKKNPEGIINSYRIIKNNEIRYIQSTIFGEKDDARGIFGVFGILKDTTEIETSKKEIEYLANYDVLTGLFNRNNFEQHSKLLDHKEGICVFICDIDGLKLINDAFGHIEGDELLIHLAEVLKRVASDNKVFRIGGDEFVIVFENTGEKEALEYEKRIKDEIKKFRLYGVGFDTSLGYDFIDKNKTFEEAFRNAENLMYRRKLTERKSRKSTVLNTIMQTMHEKTEETEEHCYRVGFLAQELLKMTGKKRDYEVEEIKLISDMHDIGKISISDTILAKPGKLDNEEYEKVKYHCESGYKIISNIIDNEDIAIAVLYHHEKYDGTGYPHGLIGEDIPLYSRIISICDAYDAMTSKRVYREALSKRQAIKEIKSNSGKQFDPTLVELFLKII